MITVENALQIIKEHTVDFGVESIPLQSSMHRILRASLQTDRSLPPYDRVTMDGIAIQFDNYQAGQRNFPIAGIAAAGMPKKELKDPTQCLEVMTGSIMPGGVDTVIQYEHMEIKDGVAHLLDKPLVRQQNIHFKGQDRQAGEVVVEMNQKISAAEIGVAASIGKAQIKVAKLPKVMVISTGDELVEIDQQPLPHQIRRSNVYRMQTTLQAYGIQADTDHLLDDKAQIVAKLAEYIQTYDVILLSGGVSKGKFDFLPEALQEIGVRQLFHKIKQKPGKPFWFGQTADQCTVFGFPGNPVSSFLCFHRYFKIWLDLSLCGKTLAVPYAMLTEDVTFKRDLTYFIEVALTYSEEAKIMAHPKKGNGSGDLANLVEADAFVELPRGKNLFKAGEIYPVYIYR
jgi:molybdopterin molybdotransferase